MKSQEPFSKSVFSPTRFYPMKKPRARELQALATVPGTYSHSLPRTTPYYKYVDANGIAHGPIDEQQLKSLAVQGIINPYTPLETDSGFTGFAGQIPDLFPEALSPAASDTEEQFIPALTAGAVAAAFCALVWSIITVITKYQIGWMAVGVGFVVGVSMQAVGNGKTPIYGVFGAGFSLFACVLGNLVTACYFIANSPELAVEGFTTMGLFITCLTNPAIALETLIEISGPLDLLFYGLALYVGYTTSFSSKT